jgi:hypothetical protein
VAIAEAPALVLLFSPTQRQSDELFKKVTDLYRALGRPIPTTQPRDSTRRLELANGSRVLSLPGEEASVRGFSGPKLVVIDEAARVSDGLFVAVRPMLAVSRGALVALSTPFAKQGWFFTEWFGTSEWNRIKITAHDCPRISPAFLAEERRVLGPRLFSQEYECEFGETIDSLFTQTDIENARADDLQPLFPRPCLKLNPSPPQRPTSSVA